MGRGVLLKNKQKINTTKSITKKNQTMTMRRKAVLAFSRGKISKNNHGGD